MARLHSRVSVSALFFFHGMIFSSWAVRIPAIQEKHGLSEAALGTILLCKPIGSLLCMPFAAMATERYGSKTVVTLSMLLYPVALVALGLQPTVLLLMLNLLCFSVVSNFINISVNTQAIALEKVYQRSVMGSLHGLWSSAGFAGGALGAFMIGSSVEPWKHFLIVLAIVLTGLFFAAPQLLVDEPRPPLEKRKFFQLPDRSLLLLGVIAFFSLLCEGTMFDWSGVYFKKVVNAEGGWIGAGYTAFMVTMAGTRFLADYLREKLSSEKILFFSGLLIFTGLMLSVAFPVLPVALIGFLLVGSGVSSIIPLVYSLTGRTSSMSPSSAVTAVATTGYFGFLLGPALIGWIAGVSSLRVSFSVIALMGLVIVYLSRKIGRA